VTGLLKAETNDLILYYFALSKQSAYKANVWVFIDTMIRAELMGTSFKNKYDSVIKVCQDILYTRSEIVTVNLPDKDNRTY
jgi:hypothetical protein